MDMLKRMLCNVKKRQLAEEDEPDTHRLLNWEASVTVLRHSQDTGRHVGRYQHGSTTTGTSSSTTNGLNQGWGKKRKYRSAHSDDASSSASSESNGNPTVPKLASLRRVTAQLGDDEVTLITNPIDEAELTCHAHQAPAGSGDITLNPLPGFRRVRHCYSYKGGEGVYVRDIDDDDDDNEEDLGNYELESSSDSDEIPTLVPSESFDESTDGDYSPDLTMPSGNKVGDLDPSLPWRRLRPPMTRGTSLPIATNHKEVRPKSAEFHLELNPSSSRTKPPSGKVKGHVRSPSDGDKNFLSLVRNGGSVRDRMARDSPQRSPSPNSPSFLHRLGIFGSKRASSKEKENIKTSASMELPAEQNNNNNGVDGRTASSSGDGRHRSRLRFRKYSAGAVSTIKDENQNQPPSPPIAVFSSDEDISSVPNTPKHNFPVSASTPITTPTSSSSASSQRMASASNVPYQNTHKIQHYQHHHPPASVAPAVPASHVTTPPSTLAVAPSGCIQQNLNRNSAPASGSCIPTRTSSYWGTKRPRPISPRLEQEISTLLMSPTKPTTTTADFTNANSLRPQQAACSVRPEPRTRSETRAAPSEPVHRSHSESRQKSLTTRRDSDSKSLIDSRQSRSKDTPVTNPEASPSSTVETHKVISFATRPTLTRLREQSRVERANPPESSTSYSASEVPYTRYRRYGERKHHSADMVEPTVTKEEPPRRGPQSSDKSAAAATSSGQRAYTRQRHHTVEVANIIIKTPEDDKKERTAHLSSSPSTSSGTFVASNIERRTGGSHRNIGIDSYRRISPGGAYIVHMSPSRWSRPSSGIDNFTSTSTSDSTPSTSYTRLSYTRTTSHPPSDNTSLNTASSTNQRGPYSSAATQVSNQRASYSGTGISSTNHRDSYSGASGVPSGLAYHRGSYSGASSTTSAPQRTTTQRRTSSDDVTLFHHRVVPGTSVPVTSSTSSAHFARSLSSPSRTDHPPTPSQPDPTRLTSSYPWAVNRRGSRSGSPHSGAVVVAPSSLSAPRPESPMTPHPTSPRRSTPPSPHTSLPPSPATTSPRTSTVGDPLLASVTDTDDVTALGVRRSVGRERGYPTTQDPNRGSIGKPADAQDISEKTAPQKTTPEGGAVVRRRPTPQSSPEKVPAGRAERPKSDCVSVSSRLERPKSDCLSVHWADSVSLASAYTDPGLLPSPRRDKRIGAHHRDRPKSDLGGAQAISDALEHYDQLRAERGDSVGALPDNPGGGKTESRMKTRRMSTPHPIKMRSERSPPNQHRARRGRLRRSRSAPDLMDRAKRTKRVFQASSSQAGDLAVQPADFSSDEEEEGCDSMSLETASETSSVSSIGRQAILDEIFEEEPPSYVEALWDHVTLDPEELGFRAGDVIEVTDMTDKDWWWGKLREKEGWFPATFVRLRANQEDTADDFAARVKEGMLDSELVLQRYSPHLLSKDQARTNVVNEIMNAEREYVKHLKDVIEGYVEKCRKRPEMFQKEQMETIFSNIEDIYRFSRELLDSLEAAFVADAPQTSQIGNVFLKHSEGFTIYSEYCNNHPHACEELRSLQKSKKYQHFFEACRLLQQMIEIPLEGFLLTPVQKICKYPLQLNELLKYTRPEHPDHQLLSRALIAMKRIAVLINERKRKMESLQKLEEWQELVQDWESPDLLETSSELIYCGELTKVNSSGWSQERIFFLFDFQIIYCKKDLLWRDIMVYKGRIDINEAEVIPVEDGKDTQFNVTVRNGFKIYDRSKDKWYLLYARTMADKDRWLKALEEERQRVELDRQNGFCLEEYRNKMPTYSARQKAHPDTKVKDKLPKRKFSRMPFSYQHEVLKSIPAHVTLPRGVSSREGLLYGQMSHKKRGWNPFSSKKTKR